MLEERLRVTGRVRLRLARTAIRLRKMAHDSAQFERARACLLQPTEQSYSNRAVDQSMTLALGRLSHVALVRLTKTNSCRNSIFDSARPDCRKMRPPIQAAR